MDRWWCAVDGLCGGTPPSSLDFCWLDLCCVSDWLDRFPRFTGIDLLLGLYADRSITSTHQRRPVGTAIGPFGGVLLETTRIVARCETIFQTILEAEKMVESQSNHSTKETEPGFVQQASESRPGLIAELWEFLSTNKKWWLTPIVLVLLLVGGLILMSGTAAAPFIYTLF